VDGVANANRAQLADVPPPMPTATMLRIRFMQQWYELSDLGVSPPEWVAYVLRQLER
jgi:hypothetical protein